MYGRMYRTNRAHVREKGGINKRIDGSGNKDRCQENMKTRLKTGVFER